MSIISYENVEIRGISAVVPKNIINNNSFSNFFTEKEIKNAIRTTGIEERRFSDKQTCSSDLSFEAAELLLKKIDIEREHIDILIFVSQTPDYHQPATAPILQNRLKLSKSCGAFDINLACSGYVYGLSTAFAYASQKGIRNVLLLVGETLSKIISQEDRATSLLFGDAGSATLIGKSDLTNSSYFSLNSDGEGKDVLKIKAGGYRFPSSPETLKVKNYEDGSKRTDEQLFMDGVEVFNFTMREVPKDIKRILKFAKKDLSEVDYIIFHQANKFMTDFFAKKLKYPIEKVPYSIQKYGNTSAVSIPLNIVAELNRDILRDKYIIMSGYGGGLSWGTSLFKINDIVIPEIKEV